MFPIRSERDAQVCNFSDVQNGWPSSNATAMSADIIVKSDGVLYADFGIVQSKEAPIAMATNRLIGSGVHLAGPLDGDEYTLYSYSVHAWCEDDELTPFVFVAVSPASITNAAGGNTCEHYSIIGVADSISTIGRSISAQGTVALPKTDVVAAGRGVCFGVGLVSGVNTSANLPAYARVNVRRLVANEPALIDATKLG